LRRSSWMRKISTRLIQILMRRFPARHAANNDCSLIYSFHYLHIKKVSPLLIALYNRSSGEALITAFCSFLYKNFSPHWKNKRRYAMIGR
ncbi:MAG: hypothetical protein U0N03_00080, partial [Lachnospiraceae bacterium]